MPASARADGGTGRIEPASSRAYRFEPDQGYLNAIVDGDLEVDRWQRRLSWQRPNLVDFWYRRNPTPRVAGNVKGRARWDDPPFVEPGMVRLRLDPRGRLSELEAIADPAGGIVARGEQRASAPRSEEVFAALFAAAELTPDEFEPTEPRWVHLVPTDGPELTVVLVDQGPVAAWSADGSSTGSAYLLGQEGKSNKACIRILQQFVASLG